MSDLSSYGIYFNEVDKICILEPESSKLTHDLKEDCSLYVEKIDEFEKIADKFISMVEELSQKIEKQKMKAIGARNLLQGMEKQKETNQQQLHAIINEVSMELERLKIQLNSLQKTEMEQNEVITQLTLY
ncbi:intraflagellar transport protein 20 homolog [Anthonomus grandis grandis]|uniref:intraflagellar transport protein 20 homolog n=1 Tax=Anthonomus grandis grandis TaxID=2921223 RepID=UPI002165A33D|nr:intraflagellar transport protein 20 homolog [Anthonomus grandis grandis]